jgi:hypothetical protein
MRLIASFFLAVFFYIAIIGFFIYFLISQQKVQKPKVVYIHQAIIAKKIKKSKPKKNKILKQIQKKAEQPKQTPTKNAKQTASKNSISTGGDDIKFDDIFSNVSDNVQTTKIKQKRRNQLTKQKSFLDEVKSQISKLKTSMKISNQNGKAEDLEYIQNELAKVWNSILTNDGDFIRIKINIQNGSLSFTVISTNLDTIRLNKFISKLKQINTAKLNNLNAVIDFKSKLKESQ